MSPGLSKIEKHFKMSFEKVITILHWEKKQSIKSLADECGVSRDTFQRQAKNKGLMLRSHKESTLLTKNKGAKHWAFGLNKNNSDLYLKHSKRMLLKNPAKDKYAASKRSKTMASILLERQLPQEKAFAKILDELKIKYEQQAPIDKYNLDFFLSKFNICIEIDSTNKWGKQRRKKALLRDMFLLEKGIKTIRINKEHIKDKLLIKNILKTNNII